jgi:hypothetical protein
VIFSFSDTLARHTHESGSWADPEPRILGGGGLPITLRPLAPGRGQLLKQYQKRPPTGMRVC